MQKTTITFYNIICLHFKKNLKNSPETRGITPLFGPNTAIFDGKLQLKG